MGPTRAAVAPTEDAKEKKKRNSPFLMVIPDDKTKEVDDPWALVTPPSTGKSWREMAGFEKFIDVAVILVKVLLLFLLLYFFICSLTFLSDAFRLLGGKAAGKALSNNKILNNPISNLMMGILATVLLQSSSTTTSIVVTMVGSSLLNVRQAIFIIMGANIGTSVTNTIVSVGQASRRDEFRRAFAGATVHDMFNWLSVMCILPLEWISGAFGSWKNCGILCQVTQAMTVNLEMEKKDTKKELLKALTKPLTKLIIQLDKKVINKYAKNNATGDETLVKHICKTVKEKVLVNATNTTNATWKIEKTTEKCHFLFEDLATKWSDSALGVLLLVLALGILCLCLILIVKLLHSLLQGKIASVLRRFINADFPGVFRHFTGYLAILIGAGFTMLVQSSSIFTSALTPLVGVGVLQLERMYPLTLGANIGTTFTAILAALASDRSVFRKTFQVALSHLFFNIFGILIWYPIPVMRHVPINLSKILGNTTAKYRWFAFLYLFIVFLIIPGFVFGLSVAGTAVLLGVGLPVFFFFVVIAVINILQSKKSKILPEKLKNWDFLPRALHSLQPYDNVFTKLCGIFKCCRKDNDN
ncbi:Sodium-dependent phosphate transport protein 2B [Lamellibrachia satsuma]|nr:Sodium-dependent phosphate transport protein 2B [Lamellibrachia satsuma]